MGEGKEFHISNYKGFDLWDTPKPDGWKAHPYPVRVTFQGVHINVFATTNDAMVVIDSMDKETVEYHRKRARVLESAQPAAPAQPATGEGGADKMAKFNVGDEVAITDEVVDMYGNVGKRGRILASAAPGYWSVQVFFEGTQSDNFTIGEDEMYPLADAGPQPAAQARAEGGADDDPRDDMDSFDLAQAWLASEFMLAGVPYEKYGSSLKALDEWKRDSEAELATLQAELADARARVEAAEATPLVRYSPEFGYIMDNETIDYILLNNDPEHSWFERHPALQDAIAEGYVTVHHRTAYTGDGATVNLELTPKGVQRVKDWQQLCKHAYKARQQSK